MNFYLGAGLWEVASALLINEVAQRRKQGADAAIGIVTTAGFAVGVAGISHQRRFTRNFEAALFGNVSGITSADLWMIAGGSRRLRRWHSRPIQAPVVQYLRSRGGGSLWHPHALGQQPPSP